MNQRSNGETTTSALSLAGSSEGEQFTTVKTSTIPTPPLPMSEKRRGKQRADDSSIEKSAATQEAAKRLPAKSWVHLVAGGLGGMSGAIVTAPFDVVKTRLQSDLFASSSKAAAVPPRSGVVNTTRRLLYHFVETGQLLRWVSTLHAVLSCRQAYICRLPQRYCPQRRSIGTL
jgi:hypothetical protein